MVCASVHKMQTIKQVYLFVQSAVRQSQVQPHFSMVSVSPNLPVTPVY